MLEVVSYQPPDWILCFAVINHTEAINIVLIKTKAIKEAMKVTCTVKRRKTLARKTSVMNWVNASSQLFSLVFPATDSE